MDYAWNVYGICFECIWNVRGTWLEYRWNLHGMCMEHAYNNNGIRQALGSKFPSNVFRPLEKIGFALSPLTPSPRAPIQPNGERHRKHACFEQTLHFPTRRRGSSTPGVFHASRQTVRDFRRLSINAPDFDAFKQKCPALASPGALGGQSDRAFRLKGQLVWSVLA